MKMKKAAYFLLLALAVACASKKDNPSPDNNNPNNPGTFTPPTTGYFKVDGKKNATSFDIVSDMVNGGNSTVSKPFEDFTRGQLRVFIPGHEAFGMKLIDSIAEGSYRAYPITTKSSTSSGLIKDSIRVELDVVASGNYFFKAKSGKVYISKKDGKLRYTSDGVLTVTGYKYLESPVVTYTRTLEFSIQRQEQL
jgi:hypothetical protein